MTVSRRLFVFGSAAAVAVLATAKLPVLGAPIQAIRSPVAYKLRRVSDIQFGCWKPAPTPQHAMAVIRVGETDIFHCGFNSHGLLHWIAVPGEEIIASDESPLNIELDQFVPNARVQLVAEDTAFDGHVQSVSEIYAFDDHGRLAHVSSMTLSP